MAFEATSFFLVLFACIAYYIYRFYKNVARYPPGPRPLPLIGNVHLLSATNTHKQIEKMAEIYGPVYTVWLPRPIVFISKLPEMKEALIKKGDIFAGRMQGVMENIFQSTQNGGVIGSENQLWRDQRRFALQTFRDFGMGRNIMEEKILHSVDTMIEQLDALAQRDEAVDLNWPIQLCVGNVINELLFAYRWSIDNCDDFVRLKDVIEYTIRNVRSRKSVLFIQTYPWMRYLPFIGWYGYRELRACTMKVIRFITEEVEKHQKSMDYDAEPNCFVSAYFVELKRRQKKGIMDTFSEEQLVSVAIDFWLAGMETTATTLRWAILYLVANPAVQRKLRAEIDAVVGRDRSPSMNDKLKMPYTAAFIMELQRKVNLLAFNVPHKTLADTEVAGLAIPANTCVMPQITSVLDCADVFPHPERFDPERFLEADGKTLNKTTSENNVPFSIGKRQCAGEALARMELFLIVVVLLQRYSFEVPAGGKGPDMTPIFGAIMQPRPYECKITMRA